MNGSREIRSNGRNFADIVTELKHELKDFVETRVALLKSEIQEKLGHLKVAAPLAALGALLLMTAYLLITLAIVALVGVFINNSFRWAIAFGAVGIVWAILGGLAAYIAKREFEVNQLKPQRTLEVLRGDKIWLEHEVKNSVPRDVPA